jgi:hypothetical protein
LVAGRRGTIGGEKPAAARVDWGERGVFEEQPCAKKTAPVWRPERLEISRSSVSKAGLIKRAFENVT